MPVDESGSNSRAATLTGLTLAGAGLAHFVKPELFDSITEKAFGHSRRETIYTNGAIETALGLGLAARKTRKLALLGTVGYVVYLAGNVARNR